jgi:transglutaminase-like putative cysteine protease
MSGSSRDFPGPARILRVLALLLLTFQARLLLADLVSLPRALGLCLLLSLAGWGLSRTSLRPWVRLAAAGALPFALRLAFFAAFRAAGAIAPSLGTDGLYPGFDETFLPLLPLWIWAVASADAAERRRSFAAFEAGLNLALLAGMFAFQGEFRGTVYPHPSLLAAVAAAQLFLSLVVLVVLAPRGSGGSPGFPFRLGVLFAALALILLAFLGRYAEGAASRGGGLLKPTLFRFDLARYLKLETEISLSDDLVLIARKDPSDPIVLVRRFVLSEYDRRGGFRPGPGDPGIPETLPRESGSWKVPPWEGRQTLEQEYWILNLEPGALLGVDAPVSVVPWRLEPGSSFASAYALSSRAAVPALSLLLGDFDPARTPPAFALSESDRDRYTRWGDDPRVRSLAEEVTGRAVSRYDRVTAVLTYLRENYYYSLKPGAAPDGDQLAHFLFRSRKGYCSYFAFSMTVMLRSLGIPARVAAGFFLDPDSAVLEFHPVRADMAHAWTEVWFGEYGWVSFDPTSREPAPGESFEESRGTDPALLESLLREILRGARDAAVPEGPGSAADRGPAWDLRRAGAWILRRSWILTPGLWLALAFLGRAVRALRLGFLEDRRARLLAAWDSLEDALSAAGKLRSRGETVVDFAERLDREGRGAPAEALGGLARDWERAVHDPAPLPEGIRDLEARIRIRRGRVRAGLPALRRVLSFLDLRRALRPLPGDTGRRGGRR